MTRWRWSVVATTNNSQTIIIVIILGSRGLPRTFLPPSGIPCTSSIVAIPPAIDVVPLQWLLRGLIHAKNNNHRTFTKLSDGAPLFAVYRRTQRPYPQPERADGVGISIAFVVNLPPSVILTHRALYFRQQRFSLPTAHPIVHIT